MKDFLKCWHSSSEGSYLPKESLQKLHDIRERATLLSTIRLKHFGAHLTHTKEIPNGDVV